MKSETPREIAERIVLTHVHPLTSTDMRALTDDVIAALKDRDERAAKIAENSPPTVRPQDDEPTAFDEGQRFGARLIAAEIRGTNAD